MKTGAFLCRAMTPQAARLAGRQVSGKSWGRGGEDCREDVAGSVSVDGGLPGGGLNKGRAEESEWWRGRWSVLFFSLSVASDGFCLAMVRLWGACGGLWP